MDELVQEYGNDATLKVPRGHQLAIVSTRSCTGAHHQIDEAIQSELFRHSAALFPL